MRDELLMPIHYRLMVSIDLSDISFRTHGRGTFSQPKSGKSVGAEFPEQSDVKYRLGSLRQFFAGLFAHHVLGVPIRPLRIGLPYPLLVLPVCDCGALQSLRKIAC